MQDYEDYIKAIVNDERITKHILDEKRCIHYYVFSSDFGTIIFRIIRDLRFGMIIEYKIDSDYHISTSQLKSYANPKEFYEKYILPMPFEYSIVSISHPGSKGQLKKPQKLKCISQIGSVILGRKTSNGVFIKDEDLYIKCNDYFSPSLKVDREDFDKPLSYLARKYVGGIHTDKFIYPDCWGDIVLRRVAWIKFSWYLAYIKEFNQSEMARMCCDKIQKYHSFQDNLSCEWAIMFENIYAMIKSILKN